MTSSWTQIVEHGKFHQHFCHFELECEHWVSFVTLSEAIKGEVNNQAKAINKDPSICFLVSYCSLKALAI
jgi:hypothetical protein